MAFKKHNRDYDIVVFGATGYTGKLTAESIIDHLPTNVKWAIAGRSKAKLEAIAAECKALNPDRTQPTIEIADSSNEAQVKALASKAFVFLAVVGPYCKYGEAAFKACAEAGTHYFDVTGESVWVAKMIKKYESAAKASGAIMIPQIGIESAPADLCTWLLASTLREELNAKTKDVVISLHKLKSAPSGGTLATVFSVFTQFSIDEIRKCYSPFSLSPVPYTNKATPPSQSIFQMLFGNFHVADLGNMSTSLAGQTDATQIGRSWGIMSTIPSRKSQFYGDNFTWAEGYKVRNWLQGLAVHWGLLLGGFLLLFVPPFRALAQKFVFQPGEGVSKEIAAKEELEYRGTATTDTAGATNKKAFCRAWYNGGFYYLTGAFMSQAALTLLEDDTGLEGGVLTPACLGQAYIDRLSNVGFHMESKILDI